jgi:DNA-binding transcriptional regulator YhcF (GntR family)
VKKDQLAVNPFAIVPIEILADRRLGLWHIKVLIGLLSFRNKNTDMIFPSREALSERIGIHPSNISKTTSELVELGWLEKIGEGGFSKSSRYKILVPSFSTTTVADSTTEKLSTTVAEITTVVESTTVADSTILTVADSAIRDVADYTTRKEQTTLTDNEQTNNIVRSAKRTIQYSVGFEKFWDCWPTNKRKVGKFKCFGIWKTKGLESRAEEMCTLVLAWSKTESWLGDFQPLPQTWLNGRYDDGMPPEDAPKETVPWYMTSSGIERAGAKLGIKQGDAETFPAFKARVFRTGEKRAPELVVKIGENWPDWQRRVNDHAGVPA